MRSIRSFFLNLLLLPWILVWGGYSILYIILTIFWGSTSHKAVLLPWLQYTSVDEITTSLFWYSLCFALGTYSFGFFLRTNFPRTKTLLIVVNLLILALLWFVNVPVLLHLFNIA
jgi:uncharacterized membrane protein YwaF